MEKPWPLDPWPQCRPRSSCAATTGSSRPTFQRRIVRERLGIVPDEMDGGHLPALSRPAELVEPPRGDPCAPHAAG